MKKLWEIYKRHREIIDYLFWGGIAFVLSMALFYVFTVSLSMGEVMANSLDWVICVIFAFFTNKFFVFRTKLNGFKGIWKEFCNFTIARIFTLLLEDLIIWALCIKAGWNTEFLIMAAKLIGQVVVIITNYILSKLWIFRKKSNEEA